MITYMPPTGGHGRIQCLELALLVRPATRYGPPCRCSSHRGPHESGAASCPAVKVPQRNWKSGTTCATTASDIMTDQGSHYFAHRDKKQITKTPPQMIQ